MKTLAFVLVDKVSHKIVGLAPIETVCKLFSSVKIERLYNLNTWFTAMYAR